MAGCYSQLPVIVNSVVLLASPAWNIPKKVYNFYFLYFHVFVIYGFLCCVNVTGIKTKSGKKRIETKRWGRPNEIGTRIITIYGNFVELKCETIREQTAEMLPK